MGCRKMTMARSTTPNRRSARPGTANRSSSVDRAGFVGTMARKIAQSRRTTTN
jgi:hypothetical protein